MYYMKQSGGLLEFEKMWRRQFVETMEPKYLPHLWSVDHKPERMEHLTDTSHWNMIGNMSRKKWALADEVNSHGLGHQAMSPIWAGLPALGRPRWLSWMRRPTGDQEVAGSTPAEVGNILSWRLIMKYFLRSFSPFRWFKKGSCQFLAKECAQYWLTA